MQRIQGFPKRLSLSLPLRSDVTEVGHKRNIYKPQKHSLFMKTRTIQVRIRWKDFMALRKKFPGRYDESAADYFERLAFRISELDLK